MSSSTTAIRARNEPDPTAGAAAAPVYRASARPREGFGGTAAFDVGSPENARAVLESVRLGAQAPGKL